MIVISENRDFGSELDALKDQLQSLEQLVLDRLDGRGGTASVPAPASTMRNKTSAAANDGESLETDRLGRADDSLGELYYTGTFLQGTSASRWEPQQRDVRQLLELDADKGAKVLAALGHKQRLELLRTVLQQPMSGTELVDKLGMGTTGQLYHHLKALTGADLLVQEERGGAYSVPAHRVLPLLLLQAAVSELLDTSDYIDMTEARTRAGNYLGTQEAGHDPHLVLWAVLENCILEHKAGFCSEVGLFAHEDGSMTVADNGRGIPVRALPQSGKPNVQAILTEMARSGASASYFAAGGEKGISMPVVNALSSRLSVEVKRDGAVYRQDYRHGIPQTPLLTVGLTSETGTSITFQPDPELFRRPFEPSQLQERVQALQATYPDLTIRY